MDPFVFASSGGRGATLKSPVVLQTLESENPLPEERKRIIEKWYEALHTVYYLHVLAVFWAKCYVTKTQLKRGA